MLEFNRFIQTKMTVLKRAALLLIPMLCVMLLLTQTAFAKNTYRINDGNRVLIHSTYATDPAEVLNEAGLELGMEDTYTTQPGLGVSEITVQRKQTIFIRCNGKLLEAASYGETVESLLSRLKVTVTQGDVLSLPLDTQTFDGMELVISTTVQTEESFFSTIPFETTYCYDASIPEGTEVVLSEGVEGQMLNTVVVNYLGGAEVSRTVVSQTVVQQPVNALIAIGTGKTLPDAPAAPGQPVIGDGVILTPEGEILNFVGKMEFNATAYTSTDPGCNEITATGTRVHKGVIAVDPRLIPYGTRMYIVSNDGKYVYGVATAEDCGGAIKGNRIDLYYDTTWECLMFGRRTCTVYFLA